MREWCKNAVYDCILMSKDFKSESVMRLVPEIKALESAVKAFLEVEEKEVVVLSSKRMALLYALMGVGVEAGDEVCMPDVSCLEADDDYSAVLKLGALPLFVGEDAVGFVSEEDGVEEVCFGSVGKMYAASLENVIKKRIETKDVKPKAIIMRSGAMAQIHLICEIAFRYGIPIIEDASGVVAGTEFYDRKLGTFGWHGYGILDLKDCNMIAGLDRIAEITAVLTPDIFVDSSDGAVLVCDGMEKKQRILELLYGAKITIY